MNTKELQTFVTLARTRNFTKTANVDIAHGEDMDDLLLRVIYDIAYTSYPSNSHLLKTAGSFRSAIVLVTTPDTAEDLKIAAGVSKKELAGSCRKTKRTALNLTLLVPWNVNIVFMAAALGVSSVSFIPYIPLIYLTPIVVIIYAAVKFRLDKIYDEGYVDVTTRLEADPKRQAEISGL